MAATAERPNFLLLWIGLVVLVMTAGLRVLIPESSPLRAREASGAVPQTPPNLLPSADSLVVPASDLKEGPLAPPQDPNVLVSGSATEPGFMRLHPEVPAQTDTAASLAGAPDLGAEASSGVQEPTQLERLAPTSLVNGIRPRPAHAESSSPERNSRSSDLAASARPVLVSFHGHSSGTVAEDDDTKKVKPPVDPEQALIVQVAPDIFRAILIVETPAVEAAAPNGGSSDPAAGAESGSESESEEDSGNGEGSETEEDAAELMDAGAEQRAFLAELRQWLHSRAGREDLTPEAMQRIRTELVRRWPGHAEDFRRILILDLNRRELADLLGQMALRAQNSAR